MFCVQNNGELRREITNTGHGVGSQVPVLRGRGRIEAFHGGVDVDDSITHVVCRNTDSVERVC